MDMSEVAYELGTNLPAEDFVSDGLKRDIGIVLTACLQEVVMVKPYDPIEFIAKWLYKHADNTMYYSNKNTHHKLVRAEAIRTHTDQAKIKYLNAQLLSLKSTHRRLDNEIKSTYTTATAATDPERDSPRPADISDLDAHQYRSARLIRAHAAAKLKAKAAKKLTAQVLAPRGASSKRSRGLLGSPKLSAISSVTSSSVSGFSMIDGFERFLSATSFLSLSPIDLGDRLAELQAQQDLVSLSVDNTPRISFSRGSSYDPFAPSSFGQMSRASTRKGSDKMKVHDGRLSIDTGCKDSTVSTESFKQRENTQLTSEGSRRSIYSETSSTRSFSTFTPSTISTEKSYETASSKASGRRPSQATTHSDTDSGTRANLAKDKGQVLQTKLKHIQAFSMPSSRTSPGSVVSEEDDDEVEDMVFKSRKQSKRLAAKETESYPQKKRPAVPAVTSMKSSPLRHEKQRASLKDMTIPPVSFVPSDAESFPPVSLVPSDAESMDTSLVSDTPRSTIRGRKETLPSLHSSIHGHEENEDLSKKLAKSSKFDREDEVQGLSNGSSGSSVSVARSSKQQLVRRPSLLENEKRVMSDRKASINLRETPLWSDLQDTMDDKRHDRVNRWRRASMRSDDTLDTEIPQRLSDTSTITSLTKGQKLQSQTDEVKQDDGSGGKIQNRVTSKSSEVLKKSKTHLAASSHKDRQRSLNSDSQPNINLDSGSPEPNDGPRKTSSHLKTSRSKVANVKLRKRQSSKIGQASSITVNITAAPGSWHFQTRHHVMVFVHPILGEIRPRQPQPMQIQSFFWDLAETSCEACYDHDLYTVCDPHADDLEYVRRILHWDGENWLTDDEATPSADETETEQGDHSGDMS